MGLDGHPYLSLPVSEGEEESHRVKPEDEASIAGMAKTRAASLVDGMSTLMRAHEKTITSLVLIAGAVSMLVDQGLDAAVMTRLVDRQRWPHLAAVMGMSIVGPQLIAWAFLRINGASSWTGLLRTLVCPLVGSVVLVFLYVSRHHAPALLRDTAIACIPISVETVVLLIQSLASGREVEGCVWGSMAEGLLEAPASAVLTLYSAMLVSVDTGSSADALSVVSFVFSMLMITKASTRLHFWGTVYESQQYARTFLLQKLPQTASQVLGFTFFAFLTRPLPDRDDDFNEELQQTNNAWLVFALLAFEVALNTGTLHTISPRMTGAVLSFFATTMTFGSPPGFLSALDGARLGHALQHLFCQAIMLAMAIRVATAEHLGVLCKNYLPFLALYAMATPWAFIGSVCMRRAEDLEERTARAAAGLDTALLAKDALMARLLLDVEQVVLREGIITGLDFKDTGRGHAQRKWSGVAACGGKAVFCPTNAEEIMLLDLASQELTFLDPGRGKGNWRWLGVAACGGKAVFCPHLAEEIMLLDLASRELTFLDTGRGKGGDKWLGVAACGGKAVFCPHSAEEIMLLDPEGCVWRQARCRELGLLA